MIGGMTYGTTYSRYDSANRLTAVTLSTLDLCHWFADVSRGKKPLDKKSNQSQRCKNNFFNQSKSKLTKFDKIQFLKILKVFGGKRVTKASDGSNNTYVTELSKRNHAERLYCVGSRAVQRIFCFGSET